MKKTAITLAFVGTLGFATVCSSQFSLALAGPAMPNAEISIDGKRPARFDHKKHASLGLACGTCHHDGKHKALDKAAIGALPNADGLRCVSCHKEGFANEKLVRPMDVFHARCKTCHSTGVKGKKGPAACNDCHLPAPAKPKPAPAKPKKVIEGC